jgi:transposase
LDCLLARWMEFDRHIAHLETRIEARCADNDAAELLETTPGVAAYMALAIASRIGDIDRFPTARSLANYFGITPSAATRAKALSVRLDH